MQTVSPTGCGNIDAKSPTKKVRHRATSLHVAKKRATITTELAQEIFLIRTIPEDKEDEQGIFAPLERSVAMSKVYGISPKAVRDVWNRSFNSRNCGFWKRIKSNAFLSQADMATRNPPFLGRVNNAD
jgi:hypothetical protein